jgi:hypothetical protein
MPEPTQTPRKITLEELLRLKRHERPGPEYWARFDRELNEKVWRALAQPAPHTNWLAGLWERRMRWLAAGAAAVAVGFVAWPGHVATIQKSAASLVATTGFSAPQFPSAREPVRVAAIFPTSENADTSSANAPARYAGSAPDASTNPAVFHKVPATVAFATERPNGARFASDTLSTADSVIRSRETAY